MKCVQGHRAFIFDRGGTTRVKPLLDLTSVKWTRDRDGISEATIRLEADACARQSDLIKSLRTHRHELVIYRGDERVWEGPLHRIAAHRSHVEIVAKDVLAYVFATPLSREWNNRNPNSTTVTNRIEEIIQWEMTHDRVQQVYDPESASWVNVTVTAWENLDQPANVVPHLDVRHFPNEAGTSAYTSPFQMTVGEHLASLARQSGIDYTTVGRSIVIWDVSRSLGRLQPMTDSNFYSNVVVSEYGADHSQSAYVVSQEGAFGQAVNVDNLDYYGPWTTVFTAYDEEGSEEATQAELDSQAQRNLAGRSPAPVEVRVPDNSGIVLTDTLTISKLVCGVQIPLVATLNARTISQMQKLDHVAVTETGNGGETVQVTLTPATRPDSDVEEETP